MTKRIAVSCAISKLDLVHAINPRIVVEAKINSMVEAVALEALLKAPSLWDEDETLP
jgi:hypothetical protein